LLFYRGYIMQDNIRHGYVPASLYTDEYIQKIRYEVMPLIVNKHCH